MAKATASNEEDCATCEQVTEDINQAMQQWCRLQLKKGVPAVRVMVPAARGLIRVALCMLGTFIEDKAWQDLRKRILDDIGNTLTNHGR